LPSKKAASENRLRFRLSFILFMKMNLHCLFVEFFSVSFNDGDGIFRTMTETGPQAIAELLAHQLRLSIDDLKSPFSTVGNTETATITFLLINPHNLSRCHGSSSSGLF